MTTTECSVDRDLALSLLRDMLLVRRFEQACAEAYAGQKIRGTLQLHIGEEAVCAGTMRALDDDDAVVAGCREPGRALLRGISAAEVMSELFGRTTGCAGGRGGSMRLFDAARRFYGGFASAAGGLPLAVGLALADRVRGRRAVTACSFGDRAAAESAFEESLRLAARWRLPVLFLCENNLFAPDTTLRAHEPVAVPIALGIAAECVDGTDVLAVREAVQRAADAVREDGSPRFVELRTSRFRDHATAGTSDAAEAAESRGTAELDPIRLFETRLRRDGTLDDASAAIVERAVAGEIAAALAAAESGPLEPAERVGDDVYVRGIP